MGTKRDAYVEKLKGNIVAWNGEIDEFQAKMGKAKDDAQVEFKKQIEEMKAKRLAIMSSGIHAGRWRDPRDIPMEDRPRAKSSMFALGELPIWISDRSGLNPRQISALARSAGGSVRFGT